MRFKTTFLFAILITLCGCSISVSQSSPFVSTSLPESSSVEPHLEPLVEHPYIKEFNKEEYAPFLYDDSYVLKYDDANNSYIICEFIHSEPTPRCLELPAYCNGLPITEIAPYAFDNIHTPRNFNELVISKNINKLYPTSLPNSALNLTIRISDENPYFVINNHCLFNREQTELIMMIDKCYPLSVPKTVKEIKEYVWDINLVTTMNLSLIYVEDGNDYFTSINGVLFDKKMTKLIHVPCCFSGDLIIPETVKEIDLNLLENRNYFENIIVEEGNPYFSSKDGMLYKGNFEELIYQPTRNQTTKLVLPNTVKAIKCKLSNLEEIVLNNNIESISGYIDCVNLKTNDSNGCGYIGSSDNPFMCLIKIPNQSLCVDDIEAVGSIVIHDDCRFVYSASPALKTRNNPYLYADETGVYSKDKKTVYHFYYSKKNSPSITFLPDTEKLCDNYDSLPTSMVLPSGKLTILIGEHFNDLDRLLSTGKNIRSVEFYNDSDYYLIQDGLLLNKDKTILYRYLGGYREVVLPNTIKVVASSAFYETDVHKVVLNDGLEEVGERAFERLVGEGILIDDFPKTLVSIGQLAFHNCPLNIVRLGSNIRFIGFCAFAKDYPTTIEIFLSSTNATIEKFAFSKSTYSVSSYTIMHLTFDNSIANTKNWNDSWYGCYLGVDGTNPFFYNGSNDYYKSYSDSHFLLDWNYSS